MNIPETTDAANTNVSLATDAEAMQEGYIPPIVIASSPTTAVTDGSTSTFAVSELNDGSVGPVWGMILCGALIGVVVGATIALLLAPRSGTQTRQEIADTLDSLKERSEGALDALQSHAAELGVRTTQTIAQTRTNLHRSIEAGREAYQQRKEELNQELEG